MTKRASAKAVQRRQGLKDKVILKKVKIGVQGAVECGDYEEWFNYTMSRAAPDTCAEFLGSFVSDTTDNLYTKGEKWLVWKFEGDYMKGRGFPLNLESVVFGRKLQGLEPNERNPLIIKQVMQD